MKEGDYSRVVADAIAQVAAGAQMLDVNAGIPLADQPAILAKSIQLVQDVVDVPLSIDSSIVEALEAGLSVYKGRPLVNSVTGEEERLEVVLPLVKKYDAAVVAISNDETGISEDPNVRYDVAKKVVERAEDYGIKRQDVVVDPLVMPVGAINSAGIGVFKLIRRLREEFKPCLLGNPKEIFDAPQVVLTFNSSLNLLINLNTPIPAELIAPTGITRGSTTTSWRFIP
jgi:5-methyltetrahydrofolate--homocysteine methyltransferase